MPKTSVQPFDEPARDTNDESSRRRGGLLGMMSTSTATDEYQAFVQSFSSSRFPQSSRTVVYSPRTTETTDFGSSSSSHTSTSPQTTNTRLASLLDSALDVLSLPEQQTHDPPSKTNHQQARQ